MPASGMTGLRRWIGAPHAPPDDASPVDENRVPPQTREVEFSAYTEDCRVFGFLALDEERLSDALNQREALALTSVLLVALDDGRAMEMQELVIERAELVAVRGSGPRGNPSRRTRTRPSPMTIKAGPFTVHGYLHAPPGADPLEHIRRRKRMVPLTEAWIEYVASGQPHRARVGPIILNRDHVDWVAPASDAEVRVDLPVEMRLDPRAKDMTGHITVWRDDEAAASSS